MNNNIAVAVVSSLALFLALVDLVIMLIMLAKLRPLFQVLSALGLS